MNKPIPFWRRPGTIGANLLVIAASLLAIFPLVVVIVTAFTPQNETIAYPPELIPSTFTLDNFAGVFERIPVGAQLWNTIMMSVGVTFFSLILNSMVAYALAFIPFKGRGLLFGLLIATMMIPFQSLLIPLYKMLTEFGWIGTMTGLIVPRAADVAGIFLLRQFFIMIPKELRAAAMIDGASEWKIYWRVMMPNATAGLLTLGIFNFVGNWNDMLWPMVMTNSAEDRTLTAGLAILNGTAQGLIPYGVTMAGSLISVLPLVIMFAIVQKRFIEGVATAGLKG
ncbi:carbohydrate ABC transporter permease [Demequina mangrovi]|uniref:Carbohydrate ABC transporter membrane protein 2, CUT1 family n=1 Tax=Demequina mangrovi TaxID=1043493 RepID=A0A1H6W201_9MICO|nr:carbohydrate ABC transporter permease [Demequina mangrovi]SEJ10913.1 carbohydrate ABC transporter membrane protein 2, CUT1 family [Demequina mangrovi]